MTSNNTTITKAKKHLRKHVRQIVKPNGWYPAWKTQLLNIKLSDVLPRG